VCSIDVQLPDEADLDQLFARGSRIARGDREKLTAGAEHDLSDGD